MQFVRPSGTPSIPISVEVDGSKRQANRVRFYDAAWVRRPGIAIPNADELMAVPDPVPQRDPLMPHCNVARK